MKTFAILITLFTSTSSFALNNEWVCHTKQFGPDHRQVSVNLYANESNAISATVYTTSTVGRYEPLFFQNLHAYGLNGAVSYVSRGIYGDFALTIRSSNYQGTLSLGSASYPVSCSRAKEMVAL